MVTLSKRGGGAQTADDLRQTDRMVADDDPGPVVQRLIFGERVRQLRETAGIEMEAANQTLKWYRGKLSKVETGLLATKPHEVEAMLTLYGLRGSKADDMRDLAADARRTAAPERVADSARQYVALERVATEIRCVYNEVPGLFQTTEYAYAQLMRSPVIPGAQATGMAEARELRGERLRRGVTQVWAVLGEEALYRECGGRDVLRRQLERLHDISSLPNVSLRILPFSAGSSPALGCPFTLLYIEPARATIAYAETLTGADYIKSTGAYKVAITQAQELSASEDETRGLLTNRIESLS